MGCVSTARYNRVEIHTPAFKISALTLSRYIFPRPTAFHSPSSTGISAGCAATACSLLASPANRAGTSARDRSAPILPAEYPVRPPRLELWTPRNPLTRKYRQCLTHRTPLTWQPVSNDMHLLLNISAPSRNVRDSTSAAVAGGLLGSSCCTSAAFMSPVVYIPQQISWRISTGKFARVAAFWYPRANLVRAVRVENPACSNAGPANPSPQKVPQQTQLSRGLLRAKKQFLSVPRPKSS